MRTFLTFLVVTFLSTISFSYEIKEGFLRTDKSLIQTIGRAARNINGRAILYADNITESIQRTIEETNRRREKQVSHNKKNNQI